jgi:hypothetical protein
MEAEGQLTEKMFIIKEAKILRETQVQGVTIILFKFVMRLEYVSLH